MTEKNNEEFVRLVGSKLKKNPVFFFFSRRKPERREIST